MIAANYVFTVAKPDGLTLGWIAPTLYFDQLVGRKEVQYDWGKYSFIGSPSESEHQLYMRTDSPYKTIEDNRKASDPSKCGCGGAIGTGFYFPRATGRNHAGEVYDCSWLSRRRPNPI